MIRLGVNIDHIATLRNARGGIEPEPVIAAGIAEKSGADSIVTHLREDRRHIKDEDVFIIKKTINTKLNLEMSINDEIVQKALEVVPYQATLVPEKRMELTTEGGLDVIKYFSEIKNVVQELKKKGILVSLFIDPDIKQIEKGWQTGAPMIEIHTGNFANSFITGPFDQERNKIMESTKAAKKIGFEVAAGHGLNYQNIFYMADIPEIIEFNIGHSIISRAVFTGLGNAVREMRNAILEGRMHGL